MLPNKGIRTTDQAHYIEDMISLVRPRSESEHQKMNASDKQENSLQSNEVNDAPTPAKTEYEDRFLDF